MVFEGEMLSSSVPIIVNLDAQNKQQANEARQSIGFAA